MRRTGHRPTERIREEHKTRFGEILKRFEGRSIAPYGMNDIKKSFDESNMRPEVAENIMGNLKKIADRLDDKEHIKNAIEAKFDGLATKVRGDERNKLEEKKMQIINEADNLLRAQFGMDLITNHVGAGIRDPEKLAETLNNVVENFNINTLAHLTPDPLHQAIENLDINSQLETFLAFLGEHTLNPSEGETVNLIFSPRNEHENLREQVREAVRGIQEGRYTEEDIRKMFENSDYHINYLHRMLENLMSWKKDKEDQEEKQQKGYIEAQSRQEYMESLMEHGQEYFIKKRGGFGKFFSWLGHYLGHLNPINWLRSREREAPKSHEDVFNAFRAKYPRRTARWNTKTFENKFNELMKAQA